MSMLFNFLYLTDAASHMFAYTARAF